LGLLCEIENNKQQVLLKIKQGMKGENNHPIAGLGQKTT